MIGRRAFLVHRLGQDLHASLAPSPTPRKVAERMARQIVGADLYREHDYTAFEVMTVADDGKPTGYVARVEVRFSRFVEQEVS